MQKETRELAQAIESLVESLLDNVSQIVVDRVNTLVGTHTMAPIDTPVAEHTFPDAPVAAPKNVVPAAPVITAPVVPPTVAPTIPAVPSTPAAPVAMMTHDEVRAHLLPIIQSNQEAMTKVHGILTGQFAVNELTSLPVAQIPEFMAQVNAALEA